MSESFRPNPTDRPDSSPAKPGENDNIISSEGLPPPPETWREMDSLNPSSSTAELPDGQNQPEEIQQKQTEQELIEKTKKELDQAFQENPEPGKEFIPPADLPPPPPEIDAFGLNTSPATAELPDNQNQKEAKLDQKNLSERLPLTEKEIANLEHLRDPEEILVALKNLNQDYHLIVHQTASDTARRIMVGQQFFSQRGLQGTAIMDSLENIAKTLPELDKPSSSRQILTHKGADGMLIMAFPKKITVPWTKRNLDHIDGFLSNQLSEKKIPYYGLPPEAIYGYYTKGELVKNPKFGPKFE